MVETGLSLADQWQTVSTNQQGFVLANSIDELYWCWYFEKKICKYIKPHNPGR